MGMTATTTSCSAALTPGSTGSLGGHPLSRAGLRYGSRPRRQEDRPSPATQATTAARVSVSGAKPWLRGDGAAPMRRKRPKRRIPAIVSIPYGFRPHRVALRRFRARARKGGAIVWAADEAARGNPPRRRPIRALRRAAKAHQAGEVSRSKRDRHNRSRSPGKPWRMTMEHLARFGAMTPWTRILEGIGRGRARFAAEGAPSS